MFGWLFGKKKESFTYKKTYSVQQDRNMTRWENHYCDTCHTLKRHKVMRVEKGHKKAVCLCRTCFNSFDIDW